MIRNLLGNVYSWVEMHGEARGEPYTWNSAAIQLKDSSRVVLVDPLDMTEDELSEIERLGSPTDILLTCDWHFRSSTTFKDRWGCKVLIPESGVPDADFPYDGAFADGDTFDTIEAIHIPGMSWPEETALLTREAGGLMVVGDALCGGRPDAGVPDGEVGVYHVKYVPDPAEGRRSIEKLLDHPFEAICFGHGTPILENPKPAIERFLGRDGLWSSMGKA